MDLNPADAVVAALIKHLACQIPGLPNGYYATRSGLVVRARAPVHTKRGTWLTVLKPRKHHRTQHRYVNIRVGKKHRTFLLPRLIALTHLGSPPEGQRLVAHENGIVDDNSADNLRWKSDKENVYDREFHRRYGRGYRRSDFVDEEGDVAYEPDPALGF